MAAEWQPIEVSAAEVGTWPCLASGSAGPALPARTGSPSSIGQQQLRALCCRGSCALALWASECPTSMPCCQSAGNLGEVAELVRSLLLSAGLWLLDPEPWATETSA